MTVAREEVEHVIEEPDAGLARAAPSPSRESVSETSVSPVLRVSSALRLLISHVLRALHRFCVPDESFGARDRCSCICKSVRRRRRGSSPRPFDGGMCATESAPA